MSHHGRLLLNRAPIDFPTSSWNQFRSCCCIICYLSMPWNCLLAGNLVVLFVAFTASFSSSFFLIQVLGRAWRWWWWCQRNVKEVPQKGKERRSSSEDKKSWMGDVTELTNLFVDAAIWISNQLRWKKKRRNNKVQLLLCQRLQNNKNMYGATLVASAATLSVTRSTIDFCFLLEFFVVFCQQQKMMISCGSSSRTLSSRLLFWYFTFFNP